MRLRHEIPTHLGVQDRAVLGLSMRQVMVGVAGLAGAYGLVTQWPELALGLRLGLALLTLLLTLALAFVQPGGRAAEEWALILLRYATLPKWGVWRPAEPDPDTWRPGTAAWVELRPHVAWHAPDKGEEV